MNIIYCEPVHQDRLVTLTLLGSEKVQKFYENKFLNVNLEFWREKLQSIYYI